MSLIHYQELPVAVHQMTLIPHTYLIAGHHHRESIQLQYMYTHEKSCAQSKPSKQRTVVLGWLALISTVYDLVRFPDFRLKCPHFGNLNQRGTHWCTEEINCSTYLSILFLEFEHFSSQLFSLHLCTVIQHHRNL